LGYVTWNVYKGSIMVLRATGIYTQVAGSNVLADRLCHLSSPWYNDLGPIPGGPAGRAAFYLVTGVTAGGVESSLGTASSGITRPNTAPCP